MAASVKVLAGVLYCRASHNCGKKLKDIIPACCRVHKRHKSSEIRHGTEDVRSPLAGIRILDLTRILAGPYCTMILGDLGAEVIKVEKPGEGDDTRRWGPPFIGTESAYFLSVNRNKKSVGIDLKSKEGRRILIQLARKSDVLVENYVPGKLEEMRLSYNHLREMAPQLIYCSITGYGNTGPYRDRAGYDVIAAAVGGLLHITGPENGQPCKVGVAMTDLATGLYAHGAIMAALIQRQMTGIGQHIHCNLLSTQVSSLVNLGSNYLNAKQEAKRWGTAHESIVPYQAFETSDGYIVLGGGNDKQFKILCERIGLPDLVDNPDYAMNEDRVKNRLSLLSVIQQRISTKSTNEWLRIFDGCGIPYGPINNMEQVFTDPQVLHNNMIVEMNHSTAGRIKLAGPPVTFSASRNSPILPPPLLGEHTDEIMGEILGYEKREVYRYREEKVIS